MIRYLLLQSASDPNYIISADDIGSMLNYQVGFFDDDYNLEVSDLAKMNSISENSFLKLGQQLTIGNKNIHRNIESKKRTILYSIKQGDNLYKISELFDVTIKSIKEINDFDDDALMPGQIIKIAIRAF